MRKNVEKFCLTGIATVLLFTNCRKNIESANDQNKILIKKELTIQWLNNQRTIQPSNQVIADIQSLANWEQSFGKAFDSENTFNVPLKSSNGNTYLRTYFNPSDLRIDSVELILVTPWDHADKRNTKRKLPENQGNVDIFNGTVTSYTTDNQFKSVKAYWNGKHVSTTVKMSKPKGSKSTIQVNSKKVLAPVCWDTYYVTFGWDGSEHWDFLYQTCDDCPTTTSIDLKSGTTVSLNCGTGGPIQVVVYWSQELLEYRNQYRLNMSSQEIDIFDNEMTWLQQIRYLTNGLAARNSALSMFPNATQLNDKADAYRHAKWVSANVFSLGKDLAQRLADAHELHPAVEPLETIMDIRNNNTAIILAHNFYVSNELLFFHDNALFQLNFNLLIWNHFTSGGFWYYSPTNTNGTLNTNSQLVQTNQ